MPDPKPPDPLMRRAYQLIKEQPGRFTARTLGPALGVSGHRTASTIVPRLENYPNMLVTESKDGLLYPFDPN
jgi:hypothetical protein